jgi:hypothetical protein
LSVGVDRRYSRWLATMRLPLPYNASVTMQFGDASGSDGATPTAVPLGIITQSGLLAVPDCQQPQC